MEWKLLKLQITQTRQPLAFQMEKYLSSTPLKWENIYQIYIKYELHILNVRTIIMQSLEYKWMKTVGVTDDTNQTSDNQFGQKKCGVSSIPSKIW